MTKKSHFCLFFLGFIYKVKTPIIDIMINMVQLDQYDK